MPTHEERAVSLPPAALVDRERILGLFDECAEKLGMGHCKEEIKNLSVCHQANGHRTTIEADDARGYLEGALFMCRAMQILNILGLKHSYFFATMRRHRARKNYEQFMRVMERAIPMYEFLASRNIRLEFLGDIEAMPCENAESFRSKLRSLEEQSRDNTGLRAIILIDYIASWAHQNQATFSKMPSVNAYVSHTIGEIVDGMELPNKMLEHSFVYAQNGSISSEWTDRQMVYLFLVCLRGMLDVRQRPWSIAYDDDQKERIRTKREKELYLRHEVLETPVTKRMMIFTAYGPEIYEF